jgi:hypothetical protein
MVNKRQLLFVPFDEEEEYLNNNKISWSELCHQTLKQKMSLSKYQRWENIQLPLILILFSIMLVLLAISNITDWVIIIICYSLSVFTFSFALFSIIWSIKNAK